MPKQFNAPDQFTRWNDEMAQKYDPDAYHTRSHAVIRWIERKRVQVIRDLLQVTPGDQVLEVGCGAGNVLEQISSGNLFGLDLSTFLLAKSQQRLATRQAHLIQANAEYLPFPSEKFDKLFCTEVLEHVLQPRQVLAEMVRIARPDAIIVISVPNEAVINRLKGVVQKTGIQRFFFARKQAGAYIPPEKMTDEWHLHEFDLAYLQNLLNGLLDVQTVRAIPNPVLPIRYVVSCQKHRGSGA